MPVPPDPPDPPEDPLPGTWDLARRAADAPFGTPWQVLSHNAGGADQAEAEALAPAPPVRPLDLVRARPRFCTCGCQGLAVPRFWFVRDDGRVARLPPVADVHGITHRARAHFLPLGEDWAEAWAGCWHGDWLLYQAVTAGVGPRPLNALGCLLARRVLDLAGGEASALRAVEAVEASLARGDEGWEGCADATVAAGAASADLARRGLRTAAEAAGAAALCGAAESVAALAFRAQMARAAEALRAACARGGADRARDAHDAARDAESLAQARLVRERLPLAAVLLALTGDA